MEDLRLWFDDPRNLTLVRLLWTLVAVLVAWIAVRLADQALVRSTRRLGRRRRWDEQQVKAAIGRTKPARLMAGIVATVFACLAVLAIWGLQTAFMGLLAGAGFLGIVIGLAAADTIGDIIAGFLIFYNHPFDIGDWVEVDGIQGIVEDVALGATTILTFDNEKVTIPNRLVEGQKVKNFSHARKLRFRIPVGVEYGTHLGTAMATLVALGKEHPDVMAEPPPQAVTVGFGASSVDLELRVWVEPVRKSVIAVRTDLVHMIHDRFRRDGIGIAFPHMQLAGGSRVEVQGFRS